MLEYFLIAGARILDLLLALFMWALIIRAILSWFAPDSRHPMAQLLYRITEPILTPVRRHLPFMGSGLDLSPMIVIFLIFFLRRFLISGLLEMARGY